MSVPPTVDIVIAARHEQRHIAACLEAIHAQDYPADLIRTFVIDNSDDDLTMAIASKFDCRVERSETVSAAAARNRGIKLGTGELVALLDAHCIADRSWITNLVARFSDARVAGCQGKIVYRHDSSLVRIVCGDLMNDSADYEMRQLVAGENGAFPAIGSNNAMFRRSLIEEVGYFATDVFNCEDIDLSWKIFLLGYQFDFAPDAIVAHASPHSLFSFVRKIFDHGRAGARLTYKYQLQRKVSDAAPAPVRWQLPLILRLLYRSGYRLEAGQIHCQPELHQYEAVDETRRQSFVWTDDSCLKVSSHVVYWFDETGSSTCVDVRANTRFVLDGPGDFFFRRICAGSCRATVTEQAVARYKQPVVTVAGDLDEFVAHLVEENILEHRLVASNNI